MKEVKLSEQEVHEILTGRLNQLSIKSRKNCKFLTKYFEDTEYISNVLSSCGPVYYNKVSPYGQKGDRVKIKDTEILLELTHISVDENELSWILHFKDL